MGSSSSEKMRTLNLGTLDTTALLVFGGPYGNLEATQALLAKAEELGISSEHIICTGDLAAYCADPAATANALRRANIQLIQGNCEQSLAASAEDCGCGFEDGSACEVLSKSWFAYCQTQLSRDTLNWFNGLPEQICFEFAGKRFLVVHGSPEGVSRFVFASNLKEHFKRDRRTPQVDCIIGGHSGLPFTQIVDDRCWHNAGVIGMPANDGTARVWYSVLRQTHTTITFEHRALHYAVDRAQEKMNQACLPQQYAASLTSGLWPSLDILPEHEARQTGVPLTEQQVEWAL